MDPIQEIKDKLDIADVIREYIPLMPAGKNMRALCPFHKEKTPSFIVSPERQTWHCFGSCNEGGDIFSFVMKYEHVEFYEALQKLAEKAGVELKRISPSSQKEFGVLYDINASAKDFFIQQKEHEPKALEYLNERGLKKDILEEFEIGFAPVASDALTLYLVNAGYDIADAERAGLVFKTERKTYMDRFRGRIMFPIYNTFGKVVGFSGRVLPEYDDGQSGKYVNSPETPIFNKSRILYGFHKTKQFIRDSQVAMLVEGQTDFLMLYQDGVHNVTATSGTALTQHHLEILKKLADRLILAFDSDEAGMIASERAIDMAHAVDLNVNVFLLKDAKDAAEYIQQNPGKIKRLVESSSMPALDFYFKRYLENVPEHALKNKIRHILEKVILIYSPLEQNRWLKKIAEKIGAPESSLIDELGLMKKKLVKKAESQTQPQIISREVPLDTRLDTVAMELLILGALDGASLLAIGEYKMFLPPRFAVALEYLAEKKPIEGEEAKAIARFAELKSSLRYGEIDFEKLPLEISVLLKELKKEFYKEKKEKLLSEIKSLEKQGKQEEAAGMLKEFDEIAKLVDN
jgi:DNA primase